MTDERLAQAGLEEEEEISLFALGTTLVQNRWRIMRWMFYGALIAGMTVISVPPRFVATASFIPRTYDADRSGLQGVAADFGVSVPGSGQGRSPDFYAQLLRSREILLPIVRDTFPVAEMGGRRVPFLELFGVTGGSSDSREERGVRILNGLISPSVVKTTGVVRVAVATEWRSVSLSIVTALLQGVNEYNQRADQGQAAAERKFVEQRLAIASRELADAENRMERFLATNRNLGSSPELMITRDRLQRDLTLRQDVFMNLTKAYEDVRIREVRDTPVTTTFESPFVPTTPESRGRLKRVLLGLVTGGFLGVLLAFGSDAMARRRQVGDAGAEEFSKAVQDAKRELSFGFRRLKRRG